MKQNHLEIKFVWQNGTLTRVMWLGIKNHGIGIQNAISILRLDSPDGRCLCRLSVYHSLSAMEKIRVSVQQILHLPLSQFVGILRTPRKGLSSETSFILCAHRDAALWPRYILLSIGRKWDHHIHHQSDTITIKWCWVGIQLYLYNGELHRRPWCRYCFGNSEKSCLGEVTSLFTDMVHTDI